MSRGTAMSTISSGRPARASSTGSELVGLEERRGRAGGGEEHVDVGERGGDVGRGARPGRRTRSASATAVSQVRLAMMSSVPALASPSAMASPMSPAPSTSPARPSRPPRRSAAMATAACDTEVMWRADAGVGAGPLAGLEGVAEQQVEGRPGGALLAGPVPGLLHLAEDLALAEHGRVEPGGHAEEVGDGRGVVVDVEVVAEVLGGEEGDLGEEVADVLVGAVEPLGHRVDLGAVARREHDGLRHVLARARGRAAPSAARRHRWSCARAGRAACCGGSAR